MKITYTCPTCKGKNVQLLFPVWVDANNIDDKSKWDMDGGAQPEKDSDKGWCVSCDDHKLLVRVEEEEDEQQADGNG